VRPSSSDTKWEAVELPHDWRIKTKPSPDYPCPVDYPKSWQGFFPTGVAYYRKIFSYDAKQGQRVAITFDGIAGFSDIWFNGHWVGQQSTCYSPISIDISEFLRPASDGPNVLLVRADSSEGEGWWYEGGGIYRHVWLETYQNVHVARNGIYVRTPTITEDEALVFVQVEIQNESADSTSFTMEAVIEEEEGGPEVARTHSTMPVTNSSLGTSSVLLAEATIKNPKLWEIGNGRQYQLTTNIKAGDGSVLDSVSLKFGVRKLEWIENGILVNGKWVKIYGANLHQDWAVYGVALPDRVMEAKLELCAEMGVNAVRTAHHPPTPELVEHADRMGMLLVLEHRLLTTSSFSLDQLRSQVRRFRSQPSVLLWSLENEEMDFQGTAVGRQLLSRLIQEVKALDLDRLTNVGGVLNLDDDYHRLPDVVGMHYRCFFGVVDSAIAYAPSKPHILDEEGLYASARGIYQYDKERGYAGSFSTILDVLQNTEKPASNAALIPPNFQITGNIPANLTQAYTHPKVSGTFVWAGLDYIGEPTPQRWPATTSSYGAKDLIGIPKDFYWLLRSLFRPDKPIVHAYPHWTWPGKEDQRIPCRAYTNCETVEFVVNGTVVAKQSASGSVVVVEGDVEYQPGELVARGYRGSELVAEHRQVTAKQASKLALLPDRTTISSSGSDVSFIRVAITDEDGNLIPDASNIINFSASGSGSIAGVHNADPSTDVYDAISAINTFNGLVGVYIKGSKTPGEVTLTASAEGLESASITLSIS
ncbi:glycoside hydrolase family 2 protein, partial [Hyaloscypha variabilis F]